MTTVGALAQPSPSLPGEQYVDTEYVYTDSSGKRLVIQNSLPKGGLTHTDPMGKAHVYAVFWTRVLNETDQPCTLTIEFPAKASALPSSPGVYYRVVLPSVAMNPENASLYNYGLANLKLILDSGVLQPASLMRTRDPGASGAFYVVVLANKGVTGTSRTGFRVNGQQLVYRINGHETTCGAVSLKQLELRK
ncbi:hypothetical protein GCM10023184_03830 [Flaviaesturariibacter amylovorans]|uniref:Gliding motility-associated C-terminal domain-containing protein n=2 Tax=Flaviaesturariibacter amylovorans TaxID=1084520 RepID=A0ABP8G836_9BACT